MTKLLIFVPVQIPKGYRPTKGNRQPPKNSGPYYVMLRNGTMPVEPWPVESASGVTRFVWRRDGEGNVIEDEYDIIAVKVADK